MILYFLLLSFRAQAFELIMIQAVSDTKRTFITRNGLRQGIIRGVTGTFTCDDISVLARAINVTGNFTQWELTHPEATLPFEKGKVVTYYGATEYLWALAPEAERKKYIKSELPRIKRAWLFKGAITRGLSESVSEAPAATSTRGGYLGEVYYERDLWGPFAFDLGFRYEREVVSYSGATLLTQRNLFISDVLYYFEFLRDYLRARYFISFGLGYGLSNTTTASLSQSGPVNLLPAIKIGANLPFNDDWEFITDAGFESLQTREEQENGNIQTTTQTNFKFGFGLKRLY
jgi:hypothetical protein